MQRVEPPAPRARISDTVSANGRRELSVTMPAPRQWFVTVFYPVWLCGWAFGLFAVLFRAPGDMPSLFRLVWLTGWLFGGLFVLLSWLWTTFGQEEVRVGGDDLVLERRVFGLRWTRGFDRAAVSFLRVTPNPPPAWWERGNAQYNAHPFQNRGCLAFDYGSATVRFGSGIDEAEAFGVMDALNERLER